MRNKYIFFGTITAALSVILGAMGAHWVGQNFTPRSVELFGTASDYQMYHSIGLILIGILAERKKHLSFFLPALFMGLGMLFFSGSIYLLALRSAFETDLSFLGPVTPLGGLCFISGWILFGIKAFQK